jgi:hypothetical protein
LGGHAIGLVRVRLGWPVIPRNEVITFEITQQLFIFHQHLGVLGSVKGVERKFEPSVFVGKRLRIVLLLYPMF